MIDKKNEYTKIFKVISLFGSVQFFQIFLNLLRGKFVSVLIGSSGVGIATIFSSTLGLLTTFFSLGLNLSYIKSISSLCDEKENEKLNKEIGIFKSWIKFLSILGLLFTILFSKVLSLITFGNYEEIKSFIILGVALYFNIKNMKNMAILQGMRKFKQLAQSSLISGIVSFLFIIPIYYYFRIKAITPVLLVIGIFNYFVSNIFIKKLNLNFQKIKLKQNFELGKENAKLGLILVMNTLVNMLVNYLIIIFITKIGSESDLGFYQAGQSITLQYVGLITSALVVDYFPRLCAVNQNNEKMKKVVNSQIEVVLFIAFPIVLIVLIGAKLAVIILLSSEFLPIINYIRLLACAMFLRMIVFSIGYIPFAKSDKRVFILTESIIGNGLIFFLTILGFYFFGIDGVGYFIWVSYLIYFIVLILVTKKQYKFYLDRNIMRIIVYSNLILIIIFFILNYQENIKTYIFSICFGIFNCLMILKILNDKLQIIKIKKIKI